MEEIENNIQNRSSDFDIPSFDLTLQNKPKQLIHLI